VNLQNRYLSLVEFLRPYAPFWQHEVLNNYPETMDAYPKEWLDLLNSKEDQELHQIDGRNNPDSIKGSSLADFIQKAQDLVIWPKETYNPEPLPAWAYKKVKEKKKHEIDCLREVILPLKEKTGFTKMADIGGGIGNLSRIMAHYHSLPTTCLDMNEDFLEKGRLRRSKYPLPKGAAKLEFEKFKFGIDTGDVVEKHFATDSLTLGLHTCGPLALEHIRSFHHYKGKAMLNFGCCYAKLHPIEETNISDFAKEHPLEFTIHGLTLATRSHSTMTFDEFLLKKRVKSFRYSLHLFLKEVLGHTEFATIGEALPSVYWGDFSQYALLKLEKIGEVDLPSKAELDQFYQDPKIQDQVHKMFLANIVRWQLGRVVEFTIILDRCLYLKEQGHKVELLQVFNEELSPRNLGILSY
jgi:hypothetical protein